jgi:hypothetical protein
VRANPFHLRSLRLGLAAGEPYRLSRALAMEAMQVAARDAASPRVEELLDDADRLAKKSGNPHGIAFVVLGRGVRRFYRGEWRGCVELVDTADLMFREACTGLAAGSPASRLYAIWSLLLLGDLREVALRLPELTRTARERGDLQAVVNFACSASHMVHLADHRVAEARAEVEHALDGYPDLGLTYQHFMNLVTRAEIDLYEGEATRAADRLAARWKELTKSPLLRTQKICVDAHWARARVMIAAGRDAKAVAAMAETITRRGAPWARPMAAAVRGSAAAMAGDGTGAAKLLAVAAAGFADGAMAMHAAVSRRRQGELSGETKLVDEADAWLREQGIAQPERYAAMIIPRHSAGR